MAARLREQIAAAGQSRVHLHVARGMGLQHLDPYATKPDGGKGTITGPHVMVVGPAVKTAPGYDRTGAGVNTAFPYVIWKNTPYEHLMIPVR